jgi:hypothetical protein
MPGEIRLLREDDIEQWNNWLYSPNDEDREWDWSEIFRQSKAEPERYECYSATTQDGLQAMARIDLQLIQIDSGEAITLDYLAVNPANRSVNEGLKYVGLAMFGAAVLRSRETKAGGALWLESLPGAVPFYEQLRMIKQLGKSKDHFDMYVLGAIEAQGVLEKLFARSILTP